MPTKRTPLDRRRKPLIDAETLALFTRLEAVPMRQRKTQAFKDKDRELARRLGLGDEWLCLHTKRSRSWQGAAAEALGLS